MIRTLLAAALITAACAPALARTVEYGFANDKGEPYCDGLQLTLKGTEVTGTHIAKDCGNNDPEGNYVGGFASKFKPSTDHLYTIATGDPYFPTYEMVLNLDLNRLTFTFYTQSNTYNQPFFKVSSGRLVKGAPPARSGAMPLLFPGKK